MGSMDSAISEPRGISGVPHIGRRGGGAEVHSLHYIWTEMGCLNDKEQGLLHFTVPSPYFHYFPPTPFGRAAGGAGCSSY